MGEKFAMIGVEVYDAKPTQIGRFWTDKTTFPLLLQGSPIGREYGLSRESTAIVDHEGKLQYRSLGHLPIKSIRQAVEETVARVPDPEPLPVDGTPVNPASWGKVKANIP